jgi:hypothetical protein
MTTWDRAARVLLSQFRAAAGRYPGDPRFAELVAALTEASPQFRDWWAEYPVRYFRPAKIRIKHPQAGRISSGRLLVSDYAADPAAGHPAAAETVRFLGFRCADQTSGGTRPGRPPVPTTWITAPPRSSGYREPLTRRAARWPGRQARRRWRSCAP